MARPPLSLKARALALLARREHSRAELGRKLLPHALAAAREGAGDADALDTAECRAAAERAVDEVLDALEAARHLSDARFVESRLHARSARFGNRRIEQELSRHGVALDAEQRRQLRDSELARAREVWARRYGQPASDPAERARQMRFLAARGFSAEVVRRVVQGPQD